MTYTKQDGSFTFYNVPPGIHLLDVQSTTYMFSHVKIQLLENDEQKHTSDEMNIKCIQYAYVGSSKQAIPHPLILTAHATYNYFQPRPTFSMFGLLKNPMVLMMLLSVVLVALMPTMMENLDPEQKEQIQKNMEYQSDPSKMLSKMWGDISGTPTPPSGNVATTLTGTSQRGKGGGKQGRRSKRD